MSTRESVDWHLAGWAAGLLAFVALGTYLLSVDQYGRGIRAEVGWPNKLSWRQSVDLPVTVENDDREPVAGASVELGRLPAPRAEISGSIRRSATGHGC
jgi:hypothetical protein